jgi:hypothetical protein
LLKVAVFESQAEAGRLFLVLDFFHFALHVLVVEFLVHHHFAHFEVLLRCLRIRLLRLFALSWLLAERTAWLLYFLMGHLVCTLLGSIEVHGFAGKHVFLLLLVFNVHFSVVI